MDLKKCIYYANTFVLKLREHKKNFDKDWFEKVRGYKSGPDGQWLNYTEFKSKKFTEDKRQIALNIVSNKNYDDLFKIEMFKIIKDLYESTDNNKVKNLCLEIIYVLNRINLKLYEYENK